MEQQPQGYKHIVRVAQTDLEGTKPIAHALCKIKGVGKHMAQALCSAASVEHTKKTGILSPEEVKALEAAIASPLKANIPEWMLNRRKDYEDGFDKHLIRADLDFTVDNDLKRLKKIKCYRGIRHQLGLTVRGQRTKSNFRRNKGKGLGVKKKSSNPAPKKDKA